ncbi:MAG: type II secretion system protein N [Sulfuricaulis sp.]|nr:type II secretion system protein N [Sulfuricaulis sp.]
MSKKRWLLYIIFGLVFYILFLIIEMPASWVAWGLNRYTQGTVRLDPISGSLWGGNGRLVMYYPPTTPHDFGQAKWHINPLWLLTGRVKLSLQTNHQDKKIKTTVEWANEYFILHDTEADFHAPFIAQIYTPLALINPQGKVSLITSELKMTPEKLEGIAVLEWSNAGSSLSSVQPLGDYRLDITGADKTANLKLTTLRGDLEFTGQGQWQLRTGQLTISGVALPRARVDELESLLRMIGKDEGGGKRTLNINTRLPPILSSN